MFNVFVTEKDILVEEGVDGDSGESETYDEHDDGADAGEALEDAEHDWIREIR